MSEESEKKKTTAEEVEEVRQILGVVSAQVPALIKGLVSAVFSEEAGTNMGRAAAAFYKELKNSGMPDDVAVKMTKDYIGVFTSLGDILKRVGKEGKTIVSTKEREDVGKEIEKLVKEKMSERIGEKEEQK